MPLLRRLALIAQQFATRLAPIAPAEGCARWNEINIRPILWITQDSSSLGLQRASEPPQLQRRIDSPILWQDGVDLSVAWADGAQHNEAAWADRLPALLAAWYGAP